MFRIENRNSTPIGGRSNERYARGEVDRDAFLQTARDLEPGAHEHDETAPPPSDGP